MSTTYIADAIRTPFGKRNGIYADVHPADLLAHTLLDLLERTGVPATAVQHVITGCIDQVGEQTANIGRTAWLAAGLPESTPATTIDSQCGSSQQALTLAHAQVASGAADIVIACGVESMTRVPMQVTYQGPGHPGSPGYLARYGTYTMQLESSELIADRWGVTRSEADAFGLASQERAAQAWQQDRFASQIVEVPLAKLTGVATDTRVARVDEGLRASTADGLAGLKPIGRDGTGVHTAATASQIADGASAVLVVSERAIQQYGLKPRAEIVDTLLIGSDPTLMLTGPIPATRELFARTGLTASDIDVFEINEAFAAVVLAWKREIGPDMDRVNPNGGAIAMGHPLGATGTALITKAVHELQVADKELALVSVCCGGGLATGTIVKRVR